MTGLEAVGQPRGELTAEQAIATIAASTIAEREGFTRDGKVIQANVALAVYTAQSLGLPLIRALDWVYIVNGSANLTAEAQRVLARRAGYDIELVDADVTHATVRIRRAGPWHQVTFTKAQADAAGLTGGRKDNWNKYLVDMLIARACTRAIGFYAAEVKAGMAAADVWADTEERAEWETAVLGDRPEPPIDPADLDQIVRTVRALPEDARRWFSGQWLEVLGCPSLLEGRALTKAHGRLARYLIDDAADTTAAEFSDRLGQAVEDAIPDRLHDAAPEAASHGSDDPAIYDDDDELGRPFGND